MKRELFQFENSGEDIKSLLDFGITIFNDVLPVTSEEECIIYNDPNTDCPMLITNVLPIKIRLSVSDESYWDQIFYQMTHELTHYAFRQRRENKDGLLKWFEETMCEAFSLYSMSVAASRWRDCKLYGVNKNYFREISRYFRAELGKRGNEIHNCGSLDCLRKINEEAESRRDYRYDIRNSTFELFEKYRNGIKEILNYPLYVNTDSLTIDFVTWASKSEFAEFVSELAGIQPNVK